ncbi:DUF2460 domain-containing protein [Notoacmeibacter sp. MSK16QG-6]|uniref:DUF2460 domain-containing protein n=1 Tax=Notoacmeibacter sp. MSK16QG-6 TaxID=2957982 RepID=UPI0020A03E70|nr:DUF2460 domain-containing protein [Notoacmeibacter sp. MSK16QG-6]MCP1198127.1 DUF2460 domain-containing protein [Notoacmeibacter sp. MSK16QG-6]
MPDIGSLPLPGFHDVLFPIAIGLGATGGPERQVEILPLRSGREARNQRRRHSLRRFDVGTGLRDVADLETLISFFEARGGAMHPFRFRDPLDYRSSVQGLPTGAFDQTLGTGDGSTTRFPLTKTYGEADGYVRPVRLPRHGTLNAAIDGNPLEETAFSFDNETGEVVFDAAPANGAQISAGFAFDIAVRFDIEHLATSLTGFRAGEVPSVPLVEVLI